MFVDPCIIVKIMKKNPTRCNNVSKPRYSLFMWSWTCFRRHTAHHQEPKTALATSGFSYVEGCWKCGLWTLSGTLIIPCLYEAQYVSGDTPPIKRSLKLHWQPLVFRTWKVVWTCGWWTLSGTVCTWQRLPSTRPNTFHVWKPRVC
jgi:hypothetical protein